MIKITEFIEKALNNLMTTKIGYYFEEHGAIIGDAEFVIYYNKKSIYLAHISEFEQEGFFIRLKNVKNR